jgi:hypothetical protein
MKTTDAVTNSAFSPDFLRRSMRMSAALTLLGALFVLVYFGSWQALAFLSGAVWTLVNMHFLAALVKSVLTAGEIDKLQVTGIALIKFPLLYISGYFLITFDRYDALFSVIGMSVFLFVVILKALGRALNKIDDPNKTTVNRESVLQ